MLTVGSEAAGYEGSVRKSSAVCELALANGTESGSEEKASPAEDRTHVGKLVKKPAGAASGPAGGDTHNGMTESAVEALSAQHEDQNNALNACLPSVMQHLLMKGTAAMEAHYRLQDTENNGAQTIWSTCSLARSPIRKHRETTTIQSSRTSASTRARSPMLVPRWDALKYANEVLNDADVLAKQATAFMKKAGKAASTAGSAGSAVGGGPATNSEDWFFGGSLRVWIWIVSSRILEETHHHCHQ